MVEQSERDLTRKLMLPNGTFKTTDRHRLDDLNAFTLPFIREIGRNGLKMMDVAASTGSTTEEWATQLAGVGISAEITATDKISCAYELHLIPGVTAMVDSNCNPIHFRVLGRGVSPNLRSPLAPVKIALRLLLLLRHHSVAGAPLISLANNATTPIEEDDLLAPNPQKWIGQFDVIRAANILNRAYFSDLELKTMMTNLTWRLRDGGVLIVARTEEESERNMATVFRASSGRLLIIGELCGGSDISSLI